MKIKHVPQVDLETGCGPACVAIVASVTYRTALRAGFDGQQPDDHTFWWKDVRYALKKLGVKHIAQAPRRTHWRTMDSLSIVGCNKDHYVVYNPEDGMVHDPLRKHGIHYKKIEEEGVLRPLSSLAILGRKRQRS